MRFEWKMFNLYALYKPVIFRYYLYIIKTIFCLQNFACIKNNPNFSFNNHESKPANILPQQIKATIYKYTTV